jgi:hypothetical protein
MKDQSSSQTDMRLQRNYNRIQNQLSPAAINLCRQLAWSFQVRLPVLLSTPDWENRLLHETRSAIEQQGVNFADMPIEDIDDMALLVLMLAAEGASQDMNDMLQRMKEANEHKQSVRALLVRLVDEAEGRAKAQGRRER